MNNASHLKMRGSAVNSDLSIQNRVLKLADKTSEPAGENPKRSNVRDALNVKMTSNVLPLKPAAMP